MSEHDAMREAGRADVLRAPGPAVAPDATGTGEARSYIAARAEAGAREAAYAADRRSLADALARQLSDRLPEGMRFEQAGDDVPPGCFRAAAGNLVREGDPLAAAFRTFVERLGEICQMLDPVLAARRERMSAMHRDYRRRQLARHRKR